MINRSILVGRIVRDIELKHTTTGIANCRFTIACNRPFKNADGNNEADFITCKAWRKTAELIAQYTKKGSLVGVEGRIQIDEYENDKGKQWDTYIAVDNVTFLDSKDDGPKPASKEKPDEVYQRVEKETDNELPF